jgi:hypothetical protein
VHFVLDLHAPLHGTLIYVRRTDEGGAVQLLGHRWHISDGWPHRLVRCEVDFDHHLIRCFACITLSWPAAAGALAASPLVGVRVQ